MTYNFKLKNKTITLTSKEILNMYIDNKIDNYDWKMLADVCDRFNIDLTQEQVESIVEILVNNDYDSICAYYEYLQ